MKMSSGDSQNTSSSVVVDTSCTNESTPASRPNIFKLNVDCFEHLFEWLSLAELLVFRRTCKRMKQVVDYYLKLNYPEILNLNIRNRNQLLIACNNRLNYFEWIKHLSIESVELNSTNIDAMKYILNQIEGLKLQIVQINGDFYDVVLQHCPRLKYLNLLTNTSADTIIGTRNEWLCRQYPMLEHFEVHCILYAFRSEHNHPLPYTAELSQFFQLNPQIKTFSVDLDYLKLCDHILLEQNVKFDRLVMYVYHFVQSISNFVNTLYQHGVYKRLHLYNNDVEFHQMVDYDFSKFNNLEKLHFFQIPSNFSTVASLRELSTRWFDPLAENLTVKPFINLRHLDIQYAAMDNIRMFVAHAPKLKRLRIISLLNNPPPLTSFKEMDELRKNLVGACKIVIHVGEELFLKFKWLSEIKFSMIELKRSDAKEMIRLFYR